MAQEKERLCLTPVLNRYYDLDEEAKKIKTERDRIKKMLRESGVPGFINDDEPELKETERIKQLIQENEKLNSELRSAEHEIYSLEKELKMYTDQNEKCRVVLRTIELEQNNKKELLSEAITWGIVIASGIVGGIGILSSTFGLPKFVRSIFEEYYTIVGGISLYVFPILLYYFIKKAIKAKKK